MLKKIARRVLPRGAAGALRARGEGVRFLFGGSLAERWRILGRIQNVSDGVLCAHGEPEAVLYAAKILELPPTVAGDIVECGCFMGGNTAKLSIVARAAGRRLVACDSFMGLPSEGGQDQVTYQLIEAGGHGSAPVVFGRGDYAGSLEQVKDAVGRLGEPSVVSYVPGFFSDTLPGWKGTASAIVIDVDLVESTRDCVRYLWPKLSPGGIIFSQDCHIREVCELLTDPGFWAELGEPHPPRFVGMGEQKLVYAYKA